MDELEQALPMCDTERRSTLSTRVQHSRAQRTAPCPLFVASCRVGGGWVGGRAGTVSVSVMQQQDGIRMNNAIPLQLAYHRLI